MWRRLLITEPEEVVPFMGAFANPHEKKGYAFGPVTALHILWNGTCKQTDRFWIIITKKSSFRKLLCVILSKEYDLHGNAV